MQQVKIKSDGNAKSVVTIIFVVISIVSSFTYGVTYEDVIYPIATILLYVICNMLFIRSDTYIASVFNLSLSLYIIASIIFSIDYKLNLGVAYGYADESLFYWLSSIEKNHLLPSNFKFINSEISHFELMDFTGYFIFLKSIGNIISLFDLSSFMTLKLTTNLSGAIVAVLIYKLLTLNANKEIAYSLSLFYALLPITIVHSSVLMRDMAVTMLTLLAVYVILSRVKWYYLISIICALLLLTFRAENAYFLLGVIALHYILYHVFKDVRRNLIFYIVILVVFVISIVIFSPLIDVIINKFISTESAYSTRAVEANIGSGSLGMKLRALPVPINYLGTSVVSQMSPFPFWGTYDGNILPFFEGLGGVIWFGVFFMAVIGYLTKSDIVSKELGFFFLMFLLYIALVSSIQPIPRRLMVAYPIVFSVAGIFYFNAPTTLKKKILYLSISLLVLLYAFYIYLKL